MLSPRMTPAEGGVQARGTSEPLRHESKTVLTRGTFDTIVPHQTPTEFVPPRSFDIKEVFWNI